MEASKRMMKAIVQRAPGGPETLEIGEVEIPIPKENEVLVKIIYTAVNRAETMQVKIKVVSDFLKI